MNSIFAVTTRGLEDISARELSTLPNVTIDQVAYRRIFASCAGLLAPLLTLRTVDDVFLHVTTWSAIGRARTALNTLQTASAQLVLRPTLDICKSLRTIQEPPTFSITANFVGKRNYNTTEIKQACAVGITERNGWTYLDNDAEADLNVRIFIEGDTASVGVRLGAKSLSKRPYKQQHVLGSLKPAVAAALLSLANVTPGTRILDPCCGAGTILIEAGAYGVTAWGGDVDREAVEAAQFNAIQANASINVQQWDARALPVANASFERVISNLPWGRAVNIDGPTQTLYQQISEEIERVLAPGGRVVLLTNLPDQVRFRRLKCNQQLEISLFGQTPTIMVWSGRA